MPQFIRPPDQIFREEGKRTGPGNSGSGIGDHLAYPTTAKRP